MEPTIEPYNMANPRRGSAVIFSHSIFDNKKYREIEGSQFDVESVTNALSQLGFEVEIYRDLRFMMLINVLEELKNRDHSDCDCFVLIIMTHGRDGDICCRDCLFDVNLLFDQFTAERCPSLADKPKLFFIESCQGPMYHYGTLVGEKCVDVESPPEERRVELVPWYSLPDQADFLIVLATLPGLYSWQGIIGSLFIRKLCYHLNLYGFREDMLKLLTRIAHSMAVDFEHFDDKKGVYYKQLPLIISFLTRPLKFTKKKRCKRKKRGMTTEDDAGSDTEKSMKRCCTDEQPSTSSQYKGHLP